MVDGILAAELDVEVRDDAVSSRSVPRATGAGVHLLADGDEEDDPDEEDGDDADGRETSERRPWLPFPSSAYRSVSPSPATLQSRPAPRYSDHAKRSR